MRVRCRDSNMAFWIKSVQLVMQVSVHLVKIHLHIVRLTKVDAFVGSMFQKLCMLRR